MDRRRHFANERVAHTTLKGKFATERFADGIWKQVTAPKVPLLNKPNGVREREVLMGASMLVLEEYEGFAFVCLQRDGYVGYLQADALAGPPWNPTHFVSAARTYAKTEPDFKLFEQICDLSMGTLLSVVGESGRWSEVAFRLSQNPERGLSYYVPTCHLRAIGDQETDPVTIAEKLMGTPYLWGGNSAFGIDCSGLVQMGCEACGILCPGDSDMQEAELGMTLPEEAKLQRGDLLFWKGHVAWVAGENLLIHANAHHMAVAYEPMDEAIARIKAQGDGDVTRRARL